jgi:LysR family transcriptional regulator, cys regulon transcriptional activator
MNLQQIRSFCEIARQGLHISAAADALHITQSGISKQLRDLEMELGISLFIRKRNKITAITEPGIALLSIAQRILRDTESMKSVSNEFTTDQHGELRISTTHTHASYTLPKVVQTFSRHYPAIKLILQQGSPSECCNRVIAGDSDLAITTETTKNYKELNVIKTYKLPRCIIAPLNHPLLKLKQPTLQKISQYPIISYDPGFSSRRAIDKVFGKQGLTPNIVLSAIDADVSKTYVELGLGIAVLPFIAFDPERDEKLRAINVEHLFESGTVNICLRRDAYIRNYIHEFISMFAPHITRKQIETSQTASSADKSITLPSLYSRPQY